jgi:uncharacterized protein with HEPN domain
MKKLLDPSDAAYIWDILQAEKLIDSFVKKVSFNAYIVNAEKTSAVERQIEIIGEAVKRLSAHFIKKHAKIPWSSIIGQRNILAHEYATVDQHLVWETATRHIPQLIKTLEPLLPTMPK